MSLSGSARASGLDRFASYRWNPRACVHDLFRNNDGSPLELDDDQAGILEALAAGKDVSVRSGHGCGKTTTDALAIFWYMLTHPYCRIPTTAPTFRQVKDILWAEVANWYQHFRLKDHFNLQSTKLSVIGQEARWFAIGVASNRQQNIEGFHAPHVLFIVDEAKGVQNGIFDSIDGALTTGGQRLYTSTPGSRIGRFYDSHFGKIAKYFHQIHINGERSKRVDQRWREQKAEEWGLDSSIYQAKILGEFPNEGDDILIPLDLILAAEAAGLEDKCSACGKLELCECDAPSVPAVSRGPRIVLGLDVARMGKDESAAAEASSRHVRILKTWSKRDLVYTTNEAVGLMRSTGAVSIGVDDTGLGGGVTDMLTKLHHIHNQPIVFGSTSELTTEEKKEHFSNNKAFLAWKFKLALEENARARAQGEAGTFVIGNDDKLKGQLSNLRVRHNNKGKVQIIDPDDPEVPIEELPKGLRMSPDRAHAALIAYHAATSAAGMPGGTLRKPDPPPPAHSPKHRRLSAFIFGRTRGSS